MKRKKDWKKELRNLNIDFEIHDGKICLWPQYFFGRSRYEYVTVKEIWRLIKGYRKNYWKKSLKYYDHIKNRARTRQMIYRNEDFPKGKVYVEDVWNWT